MKHLTPAAIIEKKRDGHELTSEDIGYFVEGVVNGQFADYQASALLMAIFLNRMSFKEIQSLTRAMLESGDRYDLSDLERPKVDKHSTGGIGDKVSLILAPLAAACGLAVPMMSGRSLGITGGTLDKLESIRGFKTQLSFSDFKTILKHIGVCMIGQSDRICPADRKLYAIRDVTATVECIPLIVASILCKKKAEGCDALILDVKVGRGAFMKTKPRARELAATLVKVGNLLGMKTSAILSQMDQPLGYAVGNSVELIEALEILSGKKFLDCDQNSTDLKELTLHLCAKMLTLGGLVSSVEKGRVLALQKLQDGSAHEIFLKMVELQGGDPKQLENPGQLPLRKHRFDIKAPRSGYISSIDNDWIGRAVIHLGGGRTKTSDTIDHGVGVLFHKKVGQNVRKGERIATVYAKDGFEQREFVEDFLTRITLKNSRAPSPRLILDPNVK